LDILLKYGKIVYMAKKQKKIVFFGTPEFAKTILEELIKTEFKPVMVITAPDKPVGRKQILSPSLVKKLAQKHQIPLFQPKTLKDSDIEEKLLALGSDLFIIAAYGLILPQNILNIPKFGSINIHPSLLPKYRGASPIQATILANDQESGTTIMLMDEKIDHGPIIALKKIKIENENSVDLSKKLAELGADMLITILPKWFGKEIKPIPQDHQKATFTRLIKKLHGKIIWGKSAQQIEQMFRAYQPWPGIYTIFDNLTLKILEIEVLKINHQPTPGKVFVTKDKELAVACEKNALILKQVQLQGKKPTFGKSFLNGHQQIINTVLS